jgi:quinol monooxygenase YgiN
MASFGMVGYLTTQPNFRDTLVNILLDAARMMQARPDCHLYQVCCDAEDRSKVWVMELWRSEEAHEKALRLPEVQAIIGLAMPLLEERPQGVTLLPLSTAASNTASSSTSLDDSGTMFCA